MQTTQTKHTEALAERYATLKAQSKLIESQLKKVTEELLSTMTPGSAITTDEYRLSCNPGRSSFTWTCTEDTKKRIQNALIEQKVADIKIGDPFVQIRFSKVTDSE